MVNQLKQFSVSKHLLIYILVQQALTKVSTKAVKSAKLAPVSTI